METLNYSTFRSQLASSMDKVINNHKPLIVTRGAEKESVIVMSLDDFKSYEETAYLMSSINNSNRLSASISELEKGDISIRELIEE
jgi:antitoxin YefM